MRRGILGGMVAAVTSTLLSLFVLPALAWRYGRFDQPPEDEAV